MSYGSSLNADILFYAERSLHLPYLEPIHDYLKETYPELNLCFSAPPFIPTTDDIAGVGLPDQDIERISAKSTFAEKSSEVHPRMAVVADVCHLSIPHIPRVVNIGHGLTCKGLYFCRSSTVRRENLSEMMCVPGAWHKKRLEENVFVPIKVTGYIKSDMLFGEGATDKYSFCKQMGINPNNNIILFAPTFNEELSAIPVVKDRIADLVDSDSIVMIKLHHMTSPYWVEMYQYLAQQYKNIIFLEDSDYSGMMHAADVMVSDVSSMFIEFMFLDKPVVLYKNHRMEEYPGFNPNNIEYKIRDAVQEADSLSQLHHEVQKALDDPQRLSELRKYYINELDYGQDGQSAKRAGEAICSRLDQKQYASRQKGGFSIFLIIDEDKGYDAIQSTINEICSKSSQSFTEVLPVCNEAVVFPWSESGCPVLAEDNEVLNYGKALTMARGEMCVLLKPGWIMPYNWLKWLNNHFLWNKNVSMVKAVSDSKLILSAFQSVVDDSRPPTLFDAVSSAMLNLCIGNSSVNDMVPSPCAMVPLPVLKACTRALVPVTDNDLIGTIEQTMTNMGLLSLSALDTVVFSMDEPFFIFDGQSLIETVDFLKQKGMQDLAVKFLQKYSKAVS